jgi:microcin C transport system ATP-binding protein
MNKRLLEVNNLHIAFAGKPVVHGIDFSIAPGEKLALVGESGSGKTVTALSLLGLVQNAQVSGSAEFQSRDGQVDLLALPEQRLRGIRGSEIAMIFQEPMTALNPLMTVGKQIAEVLVLKEALTQANAAAAAIKLLAETGIAEPERRSRCLPHQLSGGQRQRAMIAMALACRPKLLLADEPTTALDVTVKLQILELLSDLQRKNGMAVLLITHDLNLVARFADRVAVMDSGHIVEQGTLAQVFEHSVHPYTQKLLASKPKRPAMEAVEQADASALIAAQQLCVAYEVPMAGLKGWFKRGSFVAVRSASFAVLPGQTLGVIGESGSGKSSLALAVLGLQAHGGTLNLLQKAWSRDAKNNKAIRKAVQVVFQDPFSSLSPRMTVEEIVGEGLAVHFPELPAAERRQRVESALADVGMSEAQFARLLSRYPHEFSGGQRQRIAIARALVVQPQVLVLDEPTSALDVTIQQQVLSLLQRLQAERGLSYLLITHDVDVIAAMAHQVLVMKDGEVLESGGVRQVLFQPQHEYTRKLVQSGAAAAPAGQVL